MSEEENQEIENEVPEEVEEESSNPIFNALFKAVEEDSPEEGEEQEEAFTPPTSIQSALHEIGQDDQPAAEEETVEEAQEEEEQPAPEAKKKKVARKKNIVDPDFKPSKPIESKPEAPQVDTSFLNDKEKARYELAKWASSNVEGFRGKDAEYLKFFKAHKDLLDRKIADDPDVNLEEDEEYIRFLKQNRPAFDVQRVNNERIRRDAEKSALDKLQPELEKQKKELAAIRNKPIAKQQIDGTKKAIANNIPKEILEGFRGDPNYTKTHALEAKIVDRVLGDANAMATAFHEINNDIIEYDPKNNIHVALAKWIDLEQDTFIKTGRTKRNGKVFVRRERFNRVPESEKNNYYTFSDEELMDMLAKRAGKSMQDQIQSTLQELQNSGFVRAGQQQAQKPSEPKTSPKPLTPSRRPGPSMDQQGSDNENKILSLLGI